jgi:hypothetical protein
MKLTDGTLVYVVMPTTRRIPVRVAPIATVQKVMSALEEKQRLDPLGYKLSYQGRQLCASDRLRDLKIKEGDSIDLIQPISPATRNDPEYIFIKDEPK